MSLLVTRNSEVPTFLPGDPIFVGDHLCCFDLIRQAVLTQYKLPEGWPIGSPVNIVPFMSLVMLYFDIYSHRWL